MILDSQCPVNILGRADIDLVDWVLGVRVDVYPSTSPSPLLTFYRAADPDSRIMLQGAFSMIIFVTCIFHEDKQHYLALDRMIVDR